MHSFEHRFEVLALTLVCVIALCGAVRAGATDDGATAARGDGVELVREWPVAESGSAARAENRLAPDATGAPRFDKRVYKSPDKALQEYNILVFEESPSVDRDYYNQALENLGLPRTVISSWGQVIPALTSQVPWDLVIIYSGYSGTSVAILDAIEEYRRFGGHLIFSYWWVGADAALDHPIEAGLGIDFVASYNDPLQFAALPETIDHPIFSDPNAVNNFPAVPTEQQIFGINGQNVVALPGATRLAELTTIVNSGAVVLSESERTIFNCWMAEEYTADLNDNQKVDIVELIENEITFLLDHAGTHSYPQTGQDFRVETAYMPGTASAMQFVFRPRAKTSPTDFQVANLTSSDGINFSGTVPGASISERGIEFFYVAIVGVTPFSYPTANPEAAPFLDRVIVRGRPGTAMPTNASYRMVGFSFEVDPSTPESVFEDDFGEPNDRVWRLLRYAPGGASPGYADYFTASEAGFFDPVVNGQGFWLAAREGRRYDANGASAEPDTMTGGVDYAQILLQPGLNQIATPFAFTVDWNARVEEVPADIEDTLWEWDPGASDYSDSDDMTAHTGYFVRNVNATQPRLVLLPFVEVVEAKAQPAAKSSRDDWRLRLALNNGERTIRHTVVGVRPDAADGFDEHDYLAPPPHPAGKRALALNLVETFAGEERRLAGDFRPPSGEGWRFELLAAGDPGVATLMLADRSEFPSGLQLVLCDPATGIGYDLGEDGRVVLPRRLEPAGTRYELLVGEGDWVESEVDELQTLPTRVDLAQNYPNPFNPETRIVFALPAPESVRLSVFDASGRRIAVLRDEVMTAGRHEVNWNGTDTSGRRVASGLYFYRLETGSSETTRRMLLIK